MAKNDFFYIAFKILTYLKYCYENDEFVDINVMNGSAFNISDTQFKRTLKMLSDDGYLINLQFIRTKTGPLYGGINELEITPKGLEYLSENSMMKKAYKTAKEIKDWIPFMN